MPCEAIGPWMTGFHELAFLPRSRGVGECVCVCVCVCVYTQLCPSTCWERAGSLTAEGTRVQGLQGGQ